MASTFLLSRRFAGLACALLLALAPVAARAQGQAGVVAQPAQISADGQKTRLTVSLSRPVEPRVFALANPPRIVVDLPGVGFADKPPGDTGRGLVAAFRHGLIAPGRSRIVIDLKKPGIAEHVAVQPTDKGATLSIEITPATREGFQRWAALKGTAQDPEKPALRPALPSADDRRPLIVIDPGHGGVDAGARAATGEEEKVVVLTFALALKDRLERSGRYRVLMTREDDTFISLPDRVKYARDNQASLLVSIHADSLSDPFGVRGATVYTLSETASDDEAARLAEKENRADLIAGVDLSDEPDEVAGILVDLARRETKAFSGRFAKTLVTSVRESMKLNKNPMRSAGFRVLKAHDVPSVLFELGYMSSAEDLKQLTSETWREKATRSMLTAIDGFFGQRVAGGQGGQTN